jgi:putative membrane protein
MRLLMQVLADLRFHFTMRKVAFVALLLAYVVMWCGGVGAHFLLGVAPAETSWAAPLFLTLAALITIVTTNSKDLLALFIVALGGFAAEVIGVRYHFLFGDYLYTATLQPQLFGVPLVMMSAWMILFGYIKQAMLHWRLPAWIKILIAALWMTAIDLLIDPLAAGLLNYWQWREQGSYYGVPMRNFIGWFAVSAILFGIVRVTTEWQKNAWAWYVGVSIIFFFSMIALAHGMFLLAGIGLLLIGIDVSLQYWRKQQV